MSRLILGIGGNTGDRAAMLVKAGKLLEGRLGRITGSSPVIESEPWGYESDNWFLNQVLIIETGKTVEEALQICLEIERSMGRIRRSSYADRNMDIDILFYDDVIVTQEKLLVPHPRLHQRMFVLRPLEKLVPDLVHPLLGVTVRELLGLCTDKTKTRWLSHHHSTVLLP